MWVKTSTPGVTSPEQLYSTAEVDQVFSGRTIGHYRILDQLRGGGMGVVYRAEDTRLGRRVAVKFLPEALLAQPGAAERFKREAKLASSLNHPSICTIFDIGEIDGHQFIVAAAAEFQYVIDQAGVFPDDQHEARVGLARAYAMAGDTPRARKAYEDFFAFWKRADLDVPLLVKAKAEYARLGASAATR